MDQKQLEALATARQQVDEAIKTSNSPTATAEQKQQALQALYHYVDVHKENTPTVEEFQARKVEAEKQAAQQAEQQAVYDAARQAIRDSEPYKEAKKYVSDLLTNQLKVAHAQGLDYRNLADAASNLLNSLNEHPRHAVEKVALLKQVMDKAATPEALNNLLHPENGKSHIARTQAEVSTNFLIGAMNEVRHSDSHTGATIDTVINKGKAEISNHVNPQFLDESRFKEFSQSAAPFNIADYITAKAAKSPENTAALINTAEQLAVAQQLQQADQGRSA